jgi:hypothetical protein
MLLTPGATRLATLEAIWREGHPARLVPEAGAAIDAAAAIVAKAAAGDAAVYGVNTGFGKLASVRVPPEDTERLQRNLILSHCCGVGETLDAHTTRLMMVLKLLSLGRGASGVRRETVTLIEACLARGRDAGDPGARVGRCLGRPRAARPYGGDADRGRRRAGGRRKAALGPGAQAGGAHAGGARAKGGTRAHQRHAVLHRLCSRGPLRRPAQPRKCRRRLVPVDRRHHGLDSAARRGAACA